MALSQASVISTDWLVFLSASLLIAVPFSVRQRSTNVIVFFLAAFFLIASKPPYAPLLLIPMLVPFITNNRHLNLAVIGITFIAAVGAAVGWNYLIISEGIYDQTISEIRAYLSADIDPQRQIRSVLQDPILFLNAIVALLMGEGRALFHQMVGVLGWLDVPIPVALVVTWGVLAVATIFLTSPTPGAKFSHRLNAGIIYIVAALVTFVLILLVLYLTWKPVNAWELFLQGRYLHPVVAAVLMGLAQLKRIGFPKGLQTPICWTLLIGAIVINLGSCLAVYNYFNRIHS
jgi:uncharacterized membrane protein